MVPSSRSNTLPDLDITRTSTVTIQKPVEIGSFPVTNLCDLMTLKKERNQKRIRFLFYFLMRLCSEHSNLDRNLLEPTVPAIVRET